MAVSARIEAGLDTSDAGQRGDKRAIEEFDYDALVEGTESGRFCGLAITGPGPRALVEVLRCRRWPVNVRRFAGATPHFPAAFGLTEIRATLRNLGLGTHHEKHRGSDLPALPPGTMVLDGDRILFVEPQPRGHGALWSPADGWRKDIVPQRTYSCLIVEGPDASGQTGQREPLGRRIAARFAPEFRLLLVITLISGSLVVAASMSVALIFETVLPTRALDTLAAILVGLVGMIAADIRLRRIRSRIVAHISGRLDYIVSVELYDKLLSMPLGMLTSSPSSEQLSRLKQFEAIRDFVGGPGLMVILDLPFVALLILAMVLVNGKVGLVALSFLAALVLVALIAVPRIRAGLLRHGAAKKAYQHLLTETLSHAGQVARRGLGPAFTARLQPAFKREVEAQARLDRSLAVLTAAIALVMTLGVAAIAFVGAWQVMEGALSGGALVACIILGSRLFGPVQQALFVALRADGLLKVLKQIDTMLLLPSAGAGPAMIPADPPNDGIHMPVTFENVVMRYPRSSEPVLKNVSLRIPHGTLTCIAGPSGAGKTSFLRVIVGDHAIQSGRVYVGSMNLAQWDGHVRADVIGYHGHKSFMIHGTIAQNLRLMAPAATDADLEAIADELGILDRIRQFPHGFETVLDQAGETRTTPAFRAQLCVARILLGRPKVLLLDQLEAGLSPRDERRLLAAIDRRLGAMSCIMVANRHSILRRADNVLLLENGQVRRFGPHGPKSRRP